MAKTKTVYYCTQCGYESPKWLGKCPGCDGWNTFTQETLVKESSRNTHKQTMTTPVILNEVSIEDSPRITTSFPELDRVLGGGIVKGSLVLVGGDPGIGKSTLLLQMSGKISDNGKEVLYISGEESLSQIKIRSERVGTFNEHLKVLCETEIEVIENAIVNSKPDVVIIDSIQTMHSNDITSIPGSIAQVRQITNTLMYLSKQYNITIFIVGHVTKSGAVAGPKILEHMVDCVLYFEGDKDGLYRILRVTKNRFGSTNEIGIFQMSDIGLEEVSNPSQFLIDENNEIQGAAITCFLDGNRPILIELQALLCKSQYSMPLRTTNGIDYKRINMLLAIIEKYYKINISSLDTYINVTGGLKLDETAIDVGLVVAILSSYYSKSINNSLVSFGEIGLSGEVKGVKHASLRVAEAIRLGYTNIIMPYTNKKDVEKNSSANINIHYIKNITDIKDIIMED